MQQEKPGKTSAKGKVIGGIIFGAIITVLLVLASGFMVETTNTDTFCVSCHAMTPMRTAWQNSPHGGQNKRGVVAQCVDCHLPHGNFVEYLTTKAITGTSDVIHNLTFDPYNFDWKKNADENRLEFTFDSACVNCHENLTPPGLPRGGLIAHRSYMNGTAEKHCVECHPHVGHKNLLEETDRYFGKK